MCGIAGIIYKAKKDIKKEIMEKMIAEMHHRGPDDKGIYIGEGISGKTNAILGHCRLSIIDLSPLGKQPMSNEDGQIWITYNGEIYNFQELRDELKRNGHRFRSRTDTEVIIHGYEEWGVNVIKRLRGMFAFGIWDSKKEEVLIARDRIGQKPLFYFSNNNIIAFASSLYSLLMVPEVEKEIDPIAIHHFLTFQYIPSPFTIFKKVKKLSPGHYHIWKNGFKESKKYWKINFKYKTKESIYEIKAHIRETLINSVKMRLISDVPLGAFLSGGIDSSIIVGIMAELSSEPVKTFSIDFEEQAFSEIKYARMIANRFNTEHHEFTVKPKALEILPKLIRQYGEPFGDSSAIPTYYVSKVTSNHVKVTLTGDAGDENFAGYKRYQYAKWFELFKYIPKTIRNNPLISFLIRNPFNYPKKQFFKKLLKIISSIDSSSGKNYLLQIKVFAEDEKDEIYTDDFKKELEGVNSITLIEEFFQKAETADLLDKILYTDIQSYLPDCLMVKVDVASMANSLEARSPFLDHEFIQYVASLPSSYKLKGNHSKWILKETFKDIIPPAILNRKKMGFGVPIEIWFRSDMKEFVYDTLLSKKAEQRGIFQKEVVEKIINNHIKKEENNAYKIWLLLNLELWFQEMERI